MGRFLSEHDIQSCHKSLLFQPGMAEGHALIRTLVHQGQQAAAIAAL